MAPPETAYVFRASPPRLRPLLGGTDLFLEISDGFQLGVTQPGPGQFVGAIESQLANYSGTFTPTAGTTYRNLAFGGSFIDVGVPDVRFENCLFAPTAVLMATSSGQARGVIGANSATAAGLYLSRCTIRPQNASNNLSGVYAYDYTAERCDVSNVTDCFATQNQANLLGNYGHDVTYYAASYQSDGVTHNDFYQKFKGGGVVRGNYSTLRAGPLSDRSAPSTSSTGGIGQHVAITPTAGLIDDFLIELNWFDYGFRGIGGAASSNPANNGGAITIRNNRFGPNIASFPVQGYGSLRRPIVVNEAQNLVGLPATGLGVPDTTNGNVNYDGTPALVYRQTP